MPWPLSEFVRLFRVDGCFSLSALEGLTDLTKGSHAERRVKRRPKHVIITALRYVLAVTDTQPMHDFDVALSYTSEDRHYVQQVAEGLRDIGVRVFYDEFAAVELWGADLYTYLTRYTGNALDSQSSLSPETMLLRSGLHTSDRAHRHGL